MNVYVGNHIAFAGQDREKVLFTFAQKQNDNNTSKKGTTSDGKHIWFWGDRNNLPADRELTVIDNNIIGEMIYTKRSLIIGQGLQAYTESYVDGTKKINPVAMPDQILEWMDNCNFYHNYLLEAANQLLIHSNLFTSFVPNMSYDKIASIKAMKCRDTRVRFYDWTLGQTPSYVLVGDYGRFIKGITQPKYKDIPYLKYKSNDGTIIVPRGERITHTYDSLFDNGVYGHPPYWGGQEWIELSNFIPRFHKANIKNGYVIRYHVEIPENAFYDRKKMMLAEGNKEETEKCIREADSAKKGFIKAADRYLAGDENVGRALYTFFAHDEMGQKIEGVKITPIHVDLKDEALLKLFAASNQANISAQGLHPSIAGIETQGKLSSGSEMRNAIELYVKIKTPVVRSLILKPFIDVCKINGWDKEYRDIKFGFEDIVLNKLDDEPTGSSNQVNTPAE